jgi:hypothetical protein
LPSVQRSVPLPGKTCLLAGKRLFVRVPWGREVATLNLRRKTQLAAAFVAFTATAIECGAFWRSGESNFAWHISYAERIASGHVRLEVLHVLYEMLVIAVHAAGASWGLAGYIIVPSAFVALTVWVLTDIYAAVLPKTNAGLLYACAAALITPLAGAVTLFTPGRYYLGYLNPIAFTPPTQTLVKALGLPLSLLAIGPAWGASSSPRKIAALAALSTLTLFAKPNAILCLIGALALILIVRRLLSLPVNYTALGLGIALPSLLGLILQFLIAYGPGSTASVIFAPFSGWFAPNTLILVVVGLAFPITAAVALWKHASNSRLAILAWTMLLVGLVMGYFFAEAGVRMWAGNFAWGPMWAACIVNVASLRLVLKAASEGISGWRLGIPLGALSLAVLCSIAFAVASFQDPSVFMAPFTCGTGADGTFGCH